MTEISGHGEIPAMLIRKEVYTLNEVLDFVAPARCDQANTGVRMYGDDLMRLQSARYLLFKAKGVACVTCGVVGKFFAKESHVNEGDNIRYHFNLYAYDAAGKEVLITKDHVIPRSLGGPTTLDNLQTMCVRCNVQKGNTMPVSTLGVTLGDVFPRLCSAAQTNRSESISPDYCPARNAAISDEP